MKEGGSTSSNYIDISKVNYKELYVFGKPTSSSTHVWSTNIFKEIIGNNTDTYRFNMGFDMDYRMEFEIQSGKLYNYGTYYGSSNVTSQAKIYVYYR